MKKFLIALLFTLCFSLSAFAAEIYNAPIPCSPQIRKSLQKIQQLPEARSLIAQIQNEGPFSIEADYTRGLEAFGAYWNLDDRIIVVHMPSHHSEGEVIGSILFEMQNAFVTSKLHQLNMLAMRGQIDKKNYVEGIEYLEYQNSLRASQMAQKGIQAGLFGRGAHLPTYPSFQEHLRIQKIGGHSGWIANSYDQISPRSNRF